MEKLYAQMLEAAPNAIVLVSRVGRIALVNAEALRLFGYSREELLGQPVEMLVPERFRADHSLLRGAYFEQPSKRAMGAGRELFGMRKDGREVPIEIGLCPVDLKGETHAMAAVIDISERRRAELRFSQVVDAAPNAMLLVDPHGTITLANTEAERLFGYSREELLRSSIDRLVPERFRSNHPAQRQAYLAQPSNRAMGMGRDLFGVRKDGVEVPVEIGLSPLDVDGRTHVLAAVVDISERKRVEDLRRQLFRDLEEFAFIASHDLRSPLRAVTNLATWVVEDAGVELGAESREHLTKMMARIRHMDQLLDDLLEYSRAGRSEHEPVEIDCTAMVRRIVELLDVPPGISVMVQPNLPVLRTHTTPLETCLRNLISNAIDHHDKQVGRIDVTAVPSVGSVRFSISDDGPGIAPEHRERIFKVFQTLSAKRGKEHTGIGLAIIRRTVESYGGRVWFESIPGQGATFHLDWPQRLGADERTETAPHANPPAPMPTRDTARLDATTPPA